MSNFDKLWDILITPPVWDGIVRGIRFSVSVFKLRSLYPLDLLDDDSLRYLASVLNDIPEDVKSSKDNIKLYLSYKKSFDPIAKVLL